MRVISLKEKVETKLKEQESAVTPVIEAAKKVMEAAAKEIQASTTAMQALIGKVANIKIEGPAAPAAQEKQEEDDGEYTMTVNVTDRDRQGNIRSIEIVRKRG